MRKRIIFSFILLMATAYAFALTLQTEYEAPLYRKETSGFQKSGEVLPTGTLVEIDEIIEYSSGQFYGKSNGYWVSFRDLKEKEIASSAIQRADILYSAPSDEADVIKRYDPPISFSIIEEKTVDYYQWLNIVTIDGTTGWVRTPYTPATAKPIALGDKKELRESHNDTSEVLEILNAGTFVFPIEKYGRWYKVETCEDSIGWIESPDFPNTLQVYAEIPFYSEYENRDKFTLLSPGTSLKPLEKIDFSFYRVETEEGETGFINIDEINTLDEQAPIETSSSSDISEENTESSALYTFSPEEAAAVARDLKKERLIINDCQMYSEMNRYSEVVMEITAPAEFKLIKNRQSLGVHWYYVKIDGNRGWVLGHNVKPSAYDKATVIKCDVYNMENDQMVPIETGIEEYPRDGLPVTILAKELQYIQVLFENGVNGWVHQENVSLKGEYPNSTLVPLYTISRLLFRLFNYNIPGLILIIVLYAGIPFALLIFITLKIGDLHFIRNIFLKGISLLLGIIIWPSLFFTFKAVISYRLYDPAVVVPIIFYVLGFLMYALSALYLISRFRCPRCRYWAGNIDKTVHTGSSTRTTTTKYSDGTTRVEKKTSHHYRDSMSCQNCGYNWQEDYTE